MQQAANIGTMITSGLSSIAAIAAGNIGSAVNSIEKAMVSGLSVALTWLTKIAGLGDLGGKIRNIINKVKGKLDKVLDKIVKKVADLINKLKIGAKNTIDKAKKFISGVFGKKSFQAKKESHSVWVDVKNNDPKFMIASTPAEGRQQLANFLNDARKVNKVDLVNPHVQQGKRIIDSGLAQIKQKAPTLTDQQARLEQMVGNFTNPLAKTVETIRVIIQDEDSNYKFVDDGGVKRMQPVTITFKYNRNNKAEMDRQVAGQQAGMNKIRLDQWTSNRNNYLMIGRDGSSKAAQDTARQTHRTTIFNQKILDLRKKNSQLPVSQQKNLTELTDEANVWVEKEMKKLAALHDPDQVAGGEGLNVTGMGSLSVNSSIGSQWKNNIHILDQAIGKVPISARSQGYVNVHIGLV